ncbi:MAG: DUF3347 domain-containing protein [Bacteroidetes bacterium]|nr:DUF3347 domain-containing protein [Flavobacteriales bacterium]NOG57153.1 DUF3347 domain-containing protein [Bacteroidota bacterium]
MKTIITFSLAFVLFACHETKLDSNYIAEENSINELEIEKSGLNKLEAEQIITGYLKIKDALVNSNPSAAASAAEGLLFDFELNENQLLEKLFHEVNLISKSKNVKQQRIYFEGLSHNIYSIAKTIDTELSIYQQFCPMAFDDQGAYWISDEEKVFNPYFGDKMLRCGRVTEVIN